MFYHFLLPLQDYLSFLRIFQYITFRSAYAALTSLVIVLLMGNIVIRWLQHLKFSEEIRELGPSSHKSKAGTPTMGGVLILGAVLVSILLWGNFSNHYLLILIGITVVLGLLGFADDYIKSILKKKEGVSPRVKLFLQVGASVAASVIVYSWPSNPSEATTLYIPFVNRALIDLQWVWIVFASIVIVGSSNAVNLTDGLDGLAIGTVTSVAVVLGIMTYLTGHSRISDYLLIPYIPAAAELTVFMAALIGAALGFLWFNSNPATVFMGDTGSLALGGIVGAVAIMIKKEIFLVIVGGIFVVEALSVIIQVFYFKLTGKRVFKMAPIHHHFELSGWPEQKVVVRMWIIGIILAIMGLSSLKIL
ncbi:MAG: phospho-N-acetylmuramoyl-pentapeptide-transferase [Spirochaetota bacterium]